MCNYRMSAWVSNMIVKLVLNVFHDKASAIVLEDCPCYLVVSKLAYF